MKRLSMCILCLLASFSVWAANPTGTFTVSVTAASTPGEVIPVLQWSTTPAASSCTASGDPAWTGPRSAAGQVTLPATVPPKSYTLSCVWPQDTQAVLSWAAPTKNTDGSDLTDLLGYHVYYGPSTSNMTLLANVNSPTTLTYTANNLALGTWFFGVKAYNQSLAESAMSNTVSKVISAPFTLTQSVSVTAPNAPTTLTVQ